MIKVLVSQKKKLTYAPNKQGCGKAVATKNQLSCSSHKSTDHLTCKTAENTEKCPSQFARPQGP